MYALVHHVCECLLLTCAPLGGMHMFQHYCDSGWGIYVFAPRELGALEGEVDRKQPESSDMPQHIDLVGSLVHSAAGSADVSLVMICH